MHARLYLDPHLVMPSIGVLLAAESFDVAVTCLIRVIGNPGLTLPTLTRHPLSFANGLCRIMSRFNLMVTVEPSALARRVIPSGGTTSSRNAAPGWAGRRRGLRRVSIRPHYHAGGLSGDSPTSARLEH